MQIVSICAFKIVSHLVEISKNKLGLWGKKGKKALRFSTLHTKVSKTKAFSESHFKEQDSAAA